MAHIITLISNTLTGFKEGVIDIMGSLSALKECVNTVQVHIRSMAVPSRKLCCILILSDDAAGQMMGRGSLL